MARMSREFSLVLLGAGILTAGYFYYREDDKLFAKEEEQTRQQVNGRQGHYHGGLIFIHGGGYAGGRASSPAMASNVSRGGIGRIGAATVGG